MQNKINAAIKHLRKNDPKLRSLIDEIGPCTLFENNSLVHKPHFHVLVWAILNQQLSVKAAKSIEEKLARLLTSPSSRKKHFNLEGISTLNDKQLASCGLSRQKIKYLRVLCNAIQTNQISLRNLSNKDNDSITNMLSPLPGIGPWTIDMFLMFSLGRLDVLPVGDLALRKAIEQNYTLPVNATHDDYYTIAEVWQPYRTIASWYLWASVD